MPAADTAALQTRHNVFAIHSWRDAEQCRRLEDLLRAAHPAMAHYTILPERAVDGTPEQIREDIATRIKFASAVVVVNGQGLHSRPMVDFEMATAVSLKKRIVVVQPHGSFDQPVPQLLDGHVYRFAPWRSDVVGRAIRGEYPYDGRVFDIAEAAERRVVAKALAAGIGIASLAILMRDISNIGQLARELHAAGVELRWSNRDTNVVLTNAFVGAAVGGLLGLLFDDAKSAAYLATAGGLLGAAVGTSKVYQARLLGTGHLRVLALQSVG